MPDVELVRDSRFLHATFISHPTIRASMSTSIHVFQQYLQQDHIDPTKTVSVFLPDQFTSSKTNIVFYQMQLGLQVKISSQLKLIRPLMTLEGFSVAAAHLGSSVAGCGCCQANRSDPMG